MVYQFGVDIKTTSHDWGKHTTYKDGGGMVSYHPPVAVKDFPVTVNGMVLW